MLNEPTGLHLLIILAGAIPALALVWWEEKETRNKRDRFIGRKRK